MTDRGLVVLAAILAVGLWFHARTEEVYTLRLPLRLRITGLDTTLYALMDLEPETVWVEMEDRGKVLLLHTFSPPPRYELHLSQARPGRNVFALDPVNVFFSAERPAKVKLIPPSILVNLDRMVYRRLLVQVPVALPESLVLVSMTVDPSRLEVRSPQTVLNTLDTVVTDTLRITNPGSLDTVLPLRPLPFTQFTPESVRVHINVQRLAGSPSTPPPGIP